MVVSIDDEVLLLLSSELPTRFPKWNFRYGREPDPRKGMTVLIVQYSQMGMFEKFGSARSWEEAFLVDEDKPARETVDRIITKLTFYLDARLIQTAHER